MSEYAVVIERGGDGGYGAYIPDLPGCVTVAKTEPEVCELIAEALEFHLQAMRDDGDPIPEPSWRAGATPKAPKLQDPAAK